MELPDDVKLAMTLPYATIVATQSDHGESSSVRQMIEKSPSMYEKSHEALFIVR